MRIRDIGLVCFLAGIACVRYFFFLPEQLPYDSFVGDAVTFSGVIVDNPDIRVSTARLIVRPHGQESHILVVVPYPYETLLSYGDEISVAGILENPEDFITSSGNEFKYKRYLALKDIYFIISNPDITIHSHKNGSRILYHLFRVRQVFMDHISRVIPPVERDLANGILLGARGGFDSDMRDEFIRTGTIHIVALSGYNITIVAEGILRLFGLFFSAIVTYGIGALFVILFVLMSGAGATAVRAGVMALIMLFARSTGRLYDAGRALIIAGLCMIAYDPRVVFDISFQLSCIATYGVLYITPRVIPSVSYLPSRFGFRELVATTLSAMIAVLPLLLYSTGILSFVSLPANIFVLPFIPLAMLLSFCAGVFGFIYVPLSVLFGYGAHLILSYILSIIHFFASFSFASTVVTSFPLVVTVVLYLGIFWWVHNTKHAT